MNYYKIIEDNYSAIWQEEPNKSPSNEKTPLFRAKKQKLNKSAFTPLKQVDIFPIEDENQEILRKTRQEQDNEFADEKINPREHNPIYEKEIIKYQIYTSGEFQEVDKLPDNIKHERDKADLESIHKKQKIQKTLKDQEKTDQYRVIATDKARIIERSTEARKNEKVTRLKAIWESKKNNGNPSKPIDSYFQKNINEKNFSRPSGEFDQPSGKPSGKLDRGLDSHLPSSSFPVAPVVVNLRKEEYDVYIGRGRGSIWGNPFPLSKFSREEAIQKYEEYIRSTPDLLEKIPSLEGKKLGCFCKPNACHGDVLVKLFNEMMGTEKSSPQKTLFDF